MIVRLAWRVLTDIRFALVAAIALACVYLVTLRRANALALAVDGHGSQVKIGWNRDSKAVREAQQGEIRVEDGGATTRIGLNHDLLRSGTVVYLRKSKRVVVRMQVGDHRETATLASAAAPAADTEQADRIGGAPSALEEINASPVPVIQARKGALLWTGKIPKNGSLTIDGGKPSVGALTGEIPEFPVQVNVYAADLSGGELRVYTAAQTHAGGNAEPPAAGRGWNRTVYRRDPRRARNVRVIEPPRVGNGWKRLVLKSGSLPLSAALIEWSVIPQDPHAP